MTRRPPQQPDLFGGLHPVGQPAPPQRDSNDVDLMHTVAANALRCGYVLVGASERVYVRTDGDEVARVPRYEEDAVHQLLRRRWLTTGAAHAVTCGAASLTGTALLVPRHTRAAVTRWTHLQRPPSWPRTTTRQPAPPDQDTRDRSGRPPRRPQEAPMTAVVDRPGRRDGEIDETQERWVTAVHEAGHALVAESLGARVAFCRVDPDGQTGRTRHDATGAQWAVVAVAGERATRLVLGLGGGSATDYRQAAHALTGTGHDLDWAEDTADDLLTAERRDLLRTARQLYRTGSHS